MAWFPGDPGVSWRRAWVQAFNLRRVNLRRLGFEAYDAYLASDLWRGLRGRALRERPDCPGRGLRGCGRRAVEVHHLDYEYATLAGTALSGLLPLCRHHHYLATHRQLQRAREKRLTQPR